MHCPLRVIAAVIGLLPLAGHFDQGAEAADPDSIALKGGETADLGALFWVSNCRSTLKSSPVAEVMEGPAELSAAVKAQQVMPRKYNCAKSVPGGELLVTASKDIRTRLQGKLFVRIKYPTKDGERQNSREINYTLFPDAAVPPPKAP